MEKEKNPELENSIQTNEEALADDCYIVMVGSLIQNGPNVNASPEELEKFFAGVKKFNKEQGKEAVRFYDPSKLSPVTDEDINF